MDHVLGSRDKEDVVNGHKVEDIIVYINKLELARRRAEKQIEALGGPAYPKRRNRDHAPEAKSTTSVVGLDTILSNPSGLSYFMEFQDQRDNMNELQFWLLIDTLDIKDNKQQNTEADSIRPLSPDEKTGTVKSTLSSTKDDPSKLIKNSRRGSLDTIIDTNDTLRDDVGMIYETYFAESAPRPVIVDHSLVDVFRAFALSDRSNNRTDSISDSDARKHEELEATNIRKKLLEAQQQVFEQMLQKDYPEFARSDLYFKFLTSYQNPMTENSSETKPNRGHSRASSSNQRNSPGPALFSAIGLSSQDRRREASEGSKRSSGGSFLDIFGLGRDRDKERERERGPKKRADTTTASFRPGFLTSNRARSNTASPVSIRTVDLEEQQQQQRSGLKRSLPVPSSSRYTGYTATPMIRTRSLNSIPNTETHGPGTKSTLSYRRSTSTMAGYDGEGSLDLTDPENPTKSAAGGDSPALQDSLLMEDAEEDEDDGSMGDSQVGLPIPRMAKDRRGKENVINAVEAALSFIMETPDLQEDLTASLLKESTPNSPCVDMTDPTFSTARDRHSGADALLEWGKSQQKSSKRRSKEKGQESGITAGVKLQGRPEAHPGSQTNGSQKRLGTRASSALDDNNDDDDDERGDDGMLSHPKVGSDLSDDSNDDFMSGTRSKRPTPSITGTSDFMNDAVQDSVHLAAPGDLLLSDRIKSLEQDIETARKHEDIVESLMQKAEREGRADVLRILKKSKSSLRREISIMEYQKTQYEVQEEENMIMPSRSTISITSSTVGHEGSKEFALYVIEVHQLAQDGSFASGWVIARRYSEFFALHQQLKEKYPSIVRQYDLPGKRGFLKLQRSFVEGRRIGLERYLQSLLQHVEICQSQELRTFLSQENVALPQFSSSSSPLIPYSFFDNDVSKDKDTEVRASSTPPFSQFNFEQLFHSGASPLQSPVANRDLLRGQMPFNAGSDSMDTSGMDGATGSGRGEGFMKHIYQTVSEGIDDMFSGGPPTVLGSISKQLGNQMMQFTVEKGETDRNKMTRRRHGSQGECDNVRLVQSEIIERTTVPSITFDIMSTSQHSLTGDRAQRSAGTLQRIQSARNRRLSSPDPHTQHQRLQFQFQQQQQQEQQKLLQRQQTQPQQPSAQQQILQQQRQGVVEPAEGVTTFTEPLCDLFIGLFELKEKNNWLRRQAVVIILQQVLGGTIERKLRDTIKSYVEENMLTFYVNKLRETLWPAKPSASPFYSELGSGFQFVTEDLGVSSTLPQTQSTDAAATAATSSSAADKPVVRTAEQKASTKDQANRKLSAFLPELLGNMVGHQNARRGARRVFAAFQNRRLNQQLVYTALDEVIAAMWPELALQSSPATPTTATPTTATSSSFPPSPSSPPPPAAAGTAAVTTPRSSVATTSTCTATASFLLTTSQSLTEASDPEKWPARPKLGRLKR